MITNTLQQIWCEVAYIGAILAHLRDIPDYHFIGTCSNSEGIFELPEWGDHVIPLNTQPEQSTAIDPALLAKIHSLWTQHVSNETKKLRRLPLGPIHDVPIMPYRPPEKRSIDVFFCGQWTGARAAVPYWRNVLKQAGFKTTVFLARNWRSGLAPSEYAEHLMDSKVALCPAGWNAETHRFYEATRSGCAVITHPQPDSWLVRDTSFRQLSSWDGPGLVQNVRELLDNIDQESKTAVQLWKDRYEPAAVAKEIRNNLFS